MPLSLIKQKVTKDIEYQDRYFYFQKSWWYKSNDEKFVGCQRISEDDVPQNIVKSWSN